MSFLFAMTSRKYLLVDFSVSHCNEPNPQPESAAVGSVAAISPFSKKSVAALHAFWMLSQKCTRILYWQLT